MTDMKRLTVSFSDEIDKEIMELRKTDEYARMSYSAIIRMLVKRGLAAKAAAQADDQKGA